MVEDASGDPASEKLREVGGISYIERKENMGFLRSCNDAAKQARGSFIFLLNNDTYVMPGAVDALARLLCERPDAGMAGARLLNSDGTQQEAGCIVWQDGSAWNYGRGDMAWKPEYGYVREVDYVSGAAIMLPRDLWNRLGGFDEHFLPAYCEDNDLAFRIRRAGLKVLYQPEACIVHYEGVSHGTDINCGIKSHQTPNLQKLKERWKNVLSRDHFPAGTKIMRARDRGTDRKMTLIIDQYVPEPDRDAGSRAIMCVIESLLRMGRIVKFWPDNRLATPGYTQALQQRAVEVISDETKGGFADWIERNRGDIDEVLISRPNVTEPYIAPLRQYSCAPIVFYGHDLHHARIGLEAELSNDKSKQAEALAMKQQELLIWRNVDYSIYLSDEEVDTIKGIDRTVQAGFVSPYVLTAARMRTMPPPSDAGLIFVAGFAHAPNTDAALWFHNCVLPLIHARKPGVKVAFIGSNPTEEVKALAGDPVEVTGWVSEAKLAEYYATARVAVAPLRFGAGVKFKVVESMFAGLPLVTTPFGAQGLKDAEGCIEICNEPTAFAAAVLRLIDDDSFWLERSSRQIDYVNRTFSSALQQRGLEDAFIKAAANNSGTRRPRSATRHVLIHHHIYKNAGSTVDTILKKHFGELHKSIEAGDPAGTVPPHLLRQFVVDNPGMRAMSSHTSRPCGSGSANILFHPADIPPSPD